MTATLNARIDGLDWPDILEELNRNGCARTGKLLRATECSALVDRYEQDDLYRSTVVIPKLRSDMFVIRLEAIVIGEQPVEVSLHAVGQGFISRNRINPDRIAAPGRNIPGIQSRAHGGDFHTGEIRMPQVADDISDTVMAW